MILPRLQLSAALQTAGLPPAVTVPLVFESNSVQGSIFATVSRPWVIDVWRAWIESLRANAPQLVEIRQLGGGRSHLVPRYILNGFCCRGHGLAAYSHGMTGYALQAAQSPTPLDHDALAFGFLHYTATPRADNLQRNGRHENLWFIDHEGLFQTFEPGDGEENEMEPAELASVTFLYCQ